RLERFRSRLSPKPRSRRARLARGGMWQGDEDVTGTWIAVDPPRELSRWERDVIARLVPHARSGALDALRVTDRCGCGRSSAGFSGVDHVRVAEGQAVDADRETIWIMLFADRDEQTLATLDVMRADGQPIAALPSPDEIAVLRTSQWIGGSAR